MSDVKFNFSDLSKDGQKFFNGKEVCDVALEKLTKTIESNDYATVYAMGYSMIDLSMVLSISAEGNGADCVFSTTPTDTYDKKLSELPHLIEDAVYANKFVDKANINCLVKCEECHNVLSIGISFFDSSKIVMPS